MKNPNLLIFIFISFSGTIANAQSFTPIELAEKIFSKDAFPDIENYISGEYTGEPNGQDLRKELSKKFILLEQSEHNAVVAMTLQDSTLQGIDIYLYFKKDTVWKMNATRALAMTGLIAGALKEAEDMTPEQVEAKIQESDQNKKNSLFSSREDYDFFIGNAKLILELDENIIMHFIAHKPEFDRIKELALQELDSVKTDSERSIELAKSLESDHKKLYISAVSYGDYKLGGNCLDFLIGGILDNTVGYLYVKNKKDLPKINSSRVIMIREIGDGWYIYKTT